MLSLGLVPPAEIGLMLANVQLAEDRIPSYLCCFGAGSGGGTQLLSGGSAGAELSWPASTTYFVAEATFLFDAETEAAQLVKQRRRWLNGMNAAFLHLLIHPGIILRSGNPLLLRLLVFLMVANMLLVRCATVTPENCLR